MRFIVFAGIVSVALGLLQPPLHWYDICMIFAGAICISFGITVRDKI